MANLRSANLRLARATFSCDACNGFVMSDTDQNKEDEVLKRMLGTPPKKHEPTTLLGKRRRKDKENGADPKADPADS